MRNIYDIFKERGFIEQATDEHMLRELFEEPITCYIGFDPTAKSLHVGSLLPIMSLAHMQREGHRPIALVGGGTSLVGDPSGKDEIRTVMTREEININAAGIKKQLSHFIDFSNDKALLLNNADWLAPLNYIDFLRDIGKHFSVNRMLAAESYRQRMETGLTFLEFNYMLLQAYDFWHLFKNYNCQLQMGGNDQWGNILAGADLTRRIEGKIIHGITFPLITTADGYKMGKTQKGAIWLDPELTSSYEYYQYWININDRDVKRFLSYFTFLSMDEIEELSRLKDEKLREAKRILAYEATKICHGQEAADNAQESAKRLFSKGIVEDIGEIPTYFLTMNALGDGIEAYILFQKTGLCKTRGEARRLISQKGAYINGQTITSFDTIVGPDDIQSNMILLRAGKKKYLKVQIQNP